MRTSGRESNEVQRTKEKKMKNEILKAINKAIKQLCRTAQNRTDRKNVV